jgi:hypothetical protein
VQSGLAGKPWGESPLKNYLTSGLKVKIIKSHRKQPGANIMKEFEAIIRTQEYDKVNLSNLEDDLWLSVWGGRAHCSTQLSRDKVIELRDALNRFLGEQANGL